MIERIPKLLPKPRPQIRFSANLRLSSFIYKVEVALSVQWVYDFIVKSRIQHCFLV